MNNLEKNKLDMYVEGSQSSFTDRLLMNQIMNNTYQNVSN